MLRFRYSGLPIHPEVDGVPLLWGDWLRWRRIKTEWNGWDFNVIYGMIYHREKREWEENYLPPGGVEGMTVLDVGAGAGETAKFFLDHGAKDIVAVEINQIALPLLRKNAERHPIRVVDRPFDVGMLDISHDFLKMDIEGYELLMLSCLENYRKPCVIECHNNYVIEAFRKAGFDGSGNVNLVKGSNQILHRWNMPEIITN